MSIYYKGDCGHSVDGSGCQICDQEKSTKMEDILKECLVYLYLENPYDKKCDACEPGNQYNPEYICAVHRLIIRIEDVLKK